MPLQLRRRTIDLGPTRSEPRPPARTVLPDPDAHPILGPLLADPPQECGVVAELYRHSAQGSPVERILGERGGAFFVFCEQLGLDVFDAELDVGYEEVVPLDPEADGLLRLALLAHAEHPDVVEDYASRLYWAEAGSQPR